MNSTEPPAPHEQAGAEKQTTSDKSATHLESQPRPPTAIEKIESSANLSSLKNTLRNTAIVKKIKQQARMPAYAVIYRIKTSRIYQKLRSVKTLHTAYMTIKSRLKKVGRYEIELTDEQLKAKVQAYLEAKKNRSPAKVVVYTAIIDNYDALKIPLDLNPEWDYVCFTDRAEFGGIHPWDARPIPFIDSDPTRCARFVKLRPDICLPEYEQSIWIDANILIRDNFLNATFKTFSNSPYLVAGIPHPQRTCTYDEFEACKNLEKDNPDILDEQKKYYHAIKFKPQQGMIETNLLFRKHHEKQVVEFQKTWWQLLNRFSRRDQLSIIPALQSASIDWMEIMPRGMFIANHPSFYIFFHGAKWTPDAIQYKVPGFLPRDFCASTKPFWRDQRHALFTIEDAANLPTDPVDIVICVHNAPDDVDRCLTSVLKHIQPHDRVIIVDDGSDTTTASIIDRYAQTSQQIEVIRHITPIGYTRSANVGLQAATAELVILLNSDTIVTPNWSRKLLQVAYQGSHIGIVGPLSNAASFQSIPRVRDPKTGKLAINQLPKTKTIEDMHTLCEQFGNARSFPLVPLVNGFCMGITQRVIQAIGYFDEESFPMGYGEEDDYTQRALDAGFVHAIATHCYVHHAKSKSFGSSRRAKLVEMGATHLRRKHGEHRIERAVATMAKQPILGSIRKQIADLVKVKTADIYRHELSRYPGLIEENAQSVLFSSHLKQISEQFSKDVNYVHKHPSVILIVQKSEELSPPNQISWHASELSQRLGVQVTLCQGTVEDVFRFPPFGIIIEQPNSYTIKDLRELLSFCKSRDIHLIGIATHKESALVDSKSSRYILKHSDTIVCLKT